MIKLKIIISIFVSLLCLFVSVANAGMYSTSYKISSTVMSSGGNMMTSANFTMLSTLGEPTVLGNGLSPNYSNYPGFLYTLLITITIGDVNGDGVANLEDMILTLQVATGQTIESIYLDADADGDGRIGLSESIMILRKLGGL